MTFPTVPSHYRPAQRVPVRIHGLTSVEIGPGYVYQGIDIDRELLHVIDPKKYPKPEPLYAEMYTPFWLGPLALAGGCFLGVVGGRLFGKLIDLCILAWHGLGA